MIEAPGLAVITEQDILGDRMVRSRGRARRSQNFLSEASALTPGDLVTHIEHGIGRYLGLRAIENEAAPKLTAVRDQLGRAQVRSPASGEVVGLTVHTVGGVIQPGQTLMEVVPKGAPLVTPVTDYVNSLGVDGQGVGGGGLAGLGEDLTRLRLRPTRCRPKRSDWLKRRRVLAEATSGLRTGRTLVETAERSVGLSAPCDQNPP